RRPGALSGGQRQRIALAAALLRRPDVLLVDEPTAALDRATSSAVLASLERASAAGAAVLVATHEADVIARCDSVLTLSDTG
ncbi:ATP-binding cassette domain-containing protein, partial [Dietzia sp. Cai40]|uniref:ATP-binding cassette domain-containing protein n=1 Tax=Dietzia sp. Cai40 TaxID=1630635 RepID=UPI0015FC39FF